MKTELKTNESSTLKRGFEVYYFDGKGGRQGPIDFEEMMRLMGVLDAEERAGNDSALYEHQLGLPLYSETDKTEDAVPDRIVEEQSSAGTGDETKEGVG